MAPKFLLLLLAICFTYFFNFALGSFGLLISSPYSLDELDRLTFTDHDRVFHSSSSGQGRSARDGNIKETGERDKLKQSNRLCRDMKAKHVLTQRQYKICRKDPGMAHTLITAYKDMYEQCTLQFQHERWNCQDRPSRIQILTRDFREKGFLEALTSAGLAVAIAKACDLGQLVTCGCTPGVQNCNKSLKYGLKMAKRFLRVKKSSRPRDANRYSHAVFLHNINLGIKTVEAVADQVCKCTGLATHCLVRSCWSQTPSLSTVAAALKASYDSAKQVNELKNTHNTWRIPGRDETRPRSNKLYTVSNEKVRPLDLVYIDSSPDFCSTSLFGPGTSGRECSLTNDTCSVLCCGRGHTFVLVKVTKRCKCIAHWCCEVRCEQCVHEETRVQCN